MDTALALPATRRTIIVPLPLGLALVVSASERAVGVAIVRAR